MNKKEEDIVAKAKTPAGKSELSKFENDFIKSIGSGRYECRDLSEKQKKILNGIWKKLFPNEVQGKMDKPEFNIQNNKLIASKLKEISRCFDNAAEHIRAGSYNDALSSLLEMEDHSTMVRSFIKG